MSNATTKIKIRRANAEDAAAIARLIFLAFAEFESLYTPEGFNSTTPDIEEIQERIAQKVVWIGIHENKIAGTVSVFVNDTDLFVRSMAVNPQFQGKGIGHALMEHVNDMAYAKGCSSISLNTTPFLYTAIKLYENVGFNRVGEGDLLGTPLIKMKKSLTAASTNKLNNYAYSK